MFRKMKLRVISFFSLIALTLSSNLFCFTVENGTQYPSELKYKMSTTGEERLLPLAANTPISFTIASGQTIELLQILVSQGGAKKMVDFQKYRYLTDNSLILSIVPWGNGYRLIRLIQ